MLGGGWPDENATACRIIGLSGGGGVSSFAIPKESSSDAAGEKGRF